MQQAYFKCLTCHHCTYSIMAYDGENHVKMHSGRNAKSSSVTTDACRLIWPVVISLDHEHSTWVMSDDITTHPRSHVVPQLRHQW